MINQNMILNKIGNNLKFVIQLDGKEIVDLFYKYGGAVNVKISKPVSPGTDEQNRAAHALLTEYYKTSLHSAPEGYTLDDFKKYMKVRYGPYSDIEIEGQKYCVIKSWADYTKGERMAFIDGLIAEIHQSGAYTVSTRVREIIEGMGSDL